MTSDADAYDKLHTFVTANKVGSYLRAVVVNPLHKDLPKVVVMFHPSCNSFDADFIRKSWGRLDAASRKHLSCLDVAPQGHSSDGDARR